MKKSTENKAIKWYMQWTTSQKRSDINAFLREAENNLKRSEYTDLLELMIYHIDQELKLII